MGSWGNGLVTTEVEPLFFLYTNLVALLIPTMMLKLHKAFSKSQNNISTMHLDTQASKIKVKINFFYKLRHLRYSVIATENVLT